MNIALFLEQSFDPDAGGVQRSTSKLAKIFKDEGHNVIVISSIYPSSEIQLWNQIPIISIDLKKRNSELKKLLEKRKISIIINQAGYSLKLTKNLIHSSNDGIKIINTLRINPLNFYTNYKQFIESFLNNKKLVFLNIVIVQKILLGYHIVKQRYDLNYIIKNTDAFVMLSKEFKPELYFLAPSVEKYNRKIHSISNPFEKPTLNITQIEKENIILFVGRLNILQKRVDLLLKIWKKLHQTLPDWKFWVVGEGEDQLFMEKYCKENNLNRVTFFGKDNPNEYYKKAKIFHMTSAFEGFGNVLVEAQSYGCVPVLFNSYAAAQDIVTHNENGMLVLPFNSNEYVQTTTALINNPEKLSQMALNGYENVNRFSYEETYKKWEQVFNSLK
ncbi:glycosyltransferase [Flavobacterium sp. Arc3]|uniref:glycosyltransferase n=1 Tax=Flavobacterium sp. Arc3 TaxID=3046686 RepID=UPI00352D3981